jgi:REP element-mobilizing transposase RayT
MPKPVLDRWLLDRQQWLVAHGVDCRQIDCRMRLEPLDAPLRQEFLKRQWNRWHDALDACYGDRVLRRPEIAEIVGDSLLHFEGERYVILDYVVMPNHVHLLASFPNETEMLAQCKSWKHYTARRINHRLRRMGHFWQADAFDHLVRSDKQFEYLRRYIAANPRRAKLQAGDALHYSRPLPASESAPK